MSGVDTKMIHLRDVELVMVVEGPAPGKEGKVQEPRASPALGRIGPSATPPKIGPWDGSIWASTSLRQFLQQQSRASATAPLLSTTTTAPPSPLATLYALLRPVTASSANP